VSGKVVQGWHSDPFGVHEARYISAAGQPTKLVRDRGVESYDEPPSGVDEVAAAMARLSAPPSAAAPRDTYGPAHDPDPQRLSRIVGFVASAIILAAVAVGFVLVALTLLHPKRASTPGAGDAAFVSLAATRTLQQQTADLVLSATTTAAGVNTEMRGTGAFELGGKAGTLNLTADTQLGPMALQEIWLNGHVYLAISINGRDLLPTGKWIEVQVSGQEAGTPNLTDGNLAAGLVSLEDRGNKVRALGTRDIGGVSCTGYTVTSADGQSTTTVWINPQQLVREITAYATVDVPSGEGPGSTASPSAATPESVDLTMDFSYSAVPLRVAAPPAASTVP
jgi:hypothetical protein